MCQQQFDAEVMAEAHERAFIMAHIICEQSLKSVRKYPRLMPEYYSGRARAAALIYPTVETLSCRNEIEFLKGDYAVRHRRTI